jgi:valyl-tRNA synthetase
MLSAERIGNYKGMKRFHARVAVNEALKEKGLYIEKKANPMQILCKGSCPVNRQGPFALPLISLFFLFLSLTQ